METITARCSQSSKMIPVKPGAGEYGTCLVRSCIQANHCSRLVAVKDVLPTAKIVFEVKPVDTTSTSNSG